MFKLFVCWFIRFVMFHELYLKLPLYQTGNILCKINFIKNTFDFKCNKVFLFVFVCVSEIVTGLKFSNDCRHLITVSGDRYAPTWVFLTAFKELNTDHSKKKRDDGLNCECLCVCSCIFVWRLPPELTIRMRQRLSHLGPSTPQHPQSAPEQRAMKLR